MLLAASIVFAPAAGSGDLSSAFPFSLLTTDYRLVLWQLISNFTNILATKLLISVFW